MLHLISNVLHGKHGMYASHAARNVYKNWLLMYRLLMECTYCFLDARFVHFSINYWAILVLISAISNVILQNVNSIPSLLSRSYIATWKTVVRLSISRAEQCALVYEFAECAVCTRVHNNYRAANLLAAVKLRVSPRYAAVSALKSAVHVVLYIHTTTTKECLRLKNCSSLSRVEKASQLLRYNLI